MEERKDVALGEEWNWPCVRELSDKTNNDIKVMECAEEIYLLEEAFVGMEDYIKRNILGDDKEDTDATTASSFTSPTFSRSPLGPACTLRPTQSLFRTFDPSEKTFLSPAIRREKTKRLPRTHWKRNHDRRS